MRIRWTPAATADLQHISDYLKENHPRYRQPTMRRLYEAVRAASWLGCSTIGLIVVRSIRVPVLIVVKSSG
jgi:hypothetical protein